MNSEYLFKTIFHGARPVNAKGCLPNPGGQVWKYQGGMHSEASQQHAGPNSLGHSTAAPLMVSTRGLGCSAGALSISSGAGRLGGTRSCVRAGGTVPARWSRQGPPTAMARIRRPAIPPRATPSHPPLFQWP